MSNESRFVNILAAFCVVVAAIAVALLIIAPVEGIFWAIVALVLAVLAKS